MSQAPPPADYRLQRSGRDPETLSRQLAGWLGTRLPQGAEPTVALRGGVEANGMSSETILLDAAWTEAGIRRAAALVARVAPRPEDIPVFPAYDLARQFEALRLVRELTDVPVPEVRWLEPTGEVLGSPFFLMDLVEGAVPQDVLPYNFGDNWLYDATSEQQRALQERTVGVIAELHGIPDAASRFRFLVPDHPGETMLAKNLARTRAWYDFAAGEIGRSELVERALAWLLAHLPQTEESVLCWGDARIGNVVYDDFRPVGVLDWEMATLGPRELDVSWLVFAHRVFEAITEVLALPGMPEFLREDDVKAYYRQLTGRALGDLGWYHLYNAVQWSVVFMRTGARQIHFGEIERPAEVEGLFHHRPVLERLVAEAGA